MEILIISLILLLLLGMPIAYSLGLSGMIYFMVEQPMLLTVLPQKLFAGFNSESMIALPLFIVMGLLMNEASLTKRIIDFCNIFFGRFRGSLAYINVFSSMIFGGISGSSASDTASIGQIMIPEMEERGYPKGFATGVTVASSTMGMIIPPSVPMIMFCVTAEQSIGKMFMAGLIPGVLICVFQLAVCSYFSIKNNYPTSEEAFSFSAMWTTIKQSIFALIMPIVVVGTVTFGIATSNESASFGVVYSIIVGLVVFKKIKLRRLPAIFLDAMKTCATIMVIISISQLYVWIFSLEGIPAAVGNFVMDLNLSPQLTLIAVMIIILIAGTFIDVTPAILLITPVFLPACIAIGIPVEQFAALLIVGLAVGAVTPPVGTCLNVASGITGMSITQVFKSASPFLLANLIVLLLICFVQPISTFVPSLL